MVEELSVSSTGSISLQLPPAMGHDMKRMNFQYPQPDRYPCNVIDPSALRRWYSSFQYPQPDRYPCNLPRDQRQHRAVNFQYPQPDRYPCNNISAHPLLRLCRLSVSSTGSISLQLYTARKDEHGTIIFQYPQPDRYPCNKKDGSLSSNPMRIFQYPQPDRYPCNEANILHE